MKRGEPLDLKLDADGDIEPADVVEGLREAITRRLDRDILEATDPGWFGEEGLGLPLASLDTPRSRRHREALSKPIEVTMSVASFPELGPGLEDCAIWMGWLQMWATVGRLAAADLKYERELCEGES